MDGRFLKKYNLCYMLVAVRGCRYHRGVFYVGVPKMQEIVSIVAVKGWLTVASRAKLSKYAVGFGEDKPHRVTAAFKALATAMACDIKDFAHLRVCHPTFVLMYEKVGIEPDSEDKKTDSQLVEVAQDNKDEVVKEALPKANDAPANPSN